MAFKNLLLTYGGLNAFESSLSHAIKLTRHYDGWLTCAVRGRPPFLNRYGGGLDVNLREMLQQAGNDEILAAKDTFNAAVHGTDIHDRCTFLGPNDIGTAQPGELARHYDMVITGLHVDADHVESPDMLALSSGRPVLVVPPGYKASKLADHALVAWDGKRSAARTLGDAMSVLEDKGRVTILTVGRHHPEWPVDGGILRHLERHGVEANHVHKTGHGKSIAAEIEDTADEIRAKLIVMGAYEHSKFSQELFGGVTHEVLRTARVPVFMAH